MRTETSTEETKTVVEHKSGGPIMKDAEAMTEVGTPMILNLSSCLTLSKVETPNSERGREEETFRR